jgi:predicted naringenin-chalcone synthase
MIGARGNNRGAIVSAAGGHLDTDGVLARRALELSRTRMWSQLSSTSTTAAPELRRSLPQPSLIAPARRVVAASIAGVQSAFAPAISQAETWESYFGAHYGFDERIKSVWDNCGVQSRHHVVDPIADADIASWGTERRMQRFQSEAVKLGVSAARGALAQAGVDVAAVDALTVISSTGYGMPGVDIKLAHELGLRNDTQRLHVGHMGCAGGLSGLAAAADAAAASGQVCLLVSVELASLHIQPASKDFEQVISHAMFSDAASAVAVVPGDRGLRVVDRISHTDPATQDMVRLDVTDHGFRIGLSPQIPAVLRGNVAATVTTLLARNGLRVNDVAGWAVHPGGPAILDVIASELDLPADALQSSRDVLRDHGHCSSATAFVVLEEVRRRTALNRGDAVVLMAFGPGMTLYAALLRHC